MGSSWTFTIHKTLIETHYGFRSLVGIHLPAFWALWAPVGIHVLAFGTLWKPVGIHWLAFGKLWAPLAPNKTPGIDYSSLYDSKSHSENLYFF